MAVFDRSKLGSFGFRGSMSAGGAAVRVEPEDLDDALDLPVGQRADTPAEPSMDDILASIRKIIADDEAGDTVPTRAEYSHPTDVSNVNDPDSEATRPGDYRPAVVLPEFQRSEVAPSEPARPEGSREDPETLADVSAQFIEPAPATTIDADLEAGMRALLAESAGAPVGAAASSMLNVERFLNRGPARTVAGSPTPAVTPSPAQLPASPAAPALVKEPVPAVTAQAIVPTLSSEEVAVQVVERWMSEHGTAMESSVEEIIRPVVRQWLAENLPTMVERLIREEIEAVSRGRTGK